MSSQLRLIAGLLVCVLKGTTAAAQGASPPLRIDVGGQFSLSGVSLNNSAAAGVSVDVNLSRILAIHGRRLWINEGPTTRTQTGVGVRTTFIRGPQYAVYGLALPSWYRVKDSPIFFDRSNFVLDLGIGIAFPIVRGLAGRIELDRDIHVFRSTSVPNPTYLNEPDLPAFIGSRWNLTFAGTYGFGAPLTVASATVHDRRWSAGPEAGVVISNSAIPMGVIGGFVAYSITRYADLDFSWANSWSANQPPTVYEGGRLTQVLAGFKTGVR